MKKKGKLAAIHGPGSSYSNAKDHGSATAGLLTSNFLETVTSIFFLYIQCKTFSFSLLCIVQVPDFCCKATCNCVVAKGPLA